MNRNKKEKDDNLDLNMLRRSSPLREEHHSEGCTDGPWGQVGVEAGQDCAGVAMGSADAAPDCSETLVLLPGLGFVNVGDPLAEVVLGSAPIIHALEPEDGLVDILLHF